MKKRTFLWLIIGCLMASPLVAMKKKKSIIPQRMNNKESALLKKCFSAACFTRLYKTNIKQFKIQSSSPKKYLHTTKFDPDVHHRLYSQKTKKFKNPWALKYIHLFSQSRKKLKKPTRKKKQKLCCTPKICNNWEPLEGWKTEEQEESFDICSFVQKEAH